MIFRWEDVGERGKNKAVLVIDALRATTTIVGLFDKGAHRVLACPTVEEAFALRASLPAAILGGERQNQALPGFDAGNSIFEYSDVMVMGREVVFSTTNGTQAIGSVAKSASWLGLACLRNRAVAAAAQRRHSDNALIVCAGTQGMTSWEDTLAAGAVVDLWPRSTWTDGALLAWTAFHAHQDDLLAGLLASHHAKVLQDAGMDRDVAYASELDASRTVPWLDAEGWFVRA